MNSIFHRTSVRKYTNQPVEQEKIEKILRAAMQASTAGNQQEWEFIVIDDKEIPHSLANISPYSSFLKNASF